MKNELKCNGELITINNHNIHIYRTGNKSNQTLIFMSGSGTVSPVYDFKILYSKLAKNFRIIVIEKFGYGYSDIFDCDCNIDTIVKLEKEILDILGEKIPYFLVPHSMSGLEAIRWKQLYPEQVKGIIGLDMATPLSYKNWTNKVIESKIKMMQNFRKFKIQNIPFVYPINKKGLSKEEIKQLKLLIKRNAFNDCYINEAKILLKNVEVVENNGEIKCPTLLFSSNGKQTMKNWVSSQKEFAKTMNAELICFDCGHYIHYYKSEEISKKIREFVNEL